jgi:3-phosphoshikimate 1-carboxyvinyltransferase
VIKSVEPGEYSGVIAIPPSKSDSQRAILSAALANGTSTLKNIGNSDDELHMLENIQLLGAIANKMDDGSYSVSRKKDFQLTVVKNVGESGLGLRLLTPVLAAKIEHVKLDGSGTLVGRPMHFFDEVLPKFGVEFKSTNGYLPFEINGTLQAAEVEVDGSQSSQYISGLLMALPLTTGTSVLNVKDLKSKPYIEMTLKTLRAFGINISHDNFERFTIAGNQEYTACAYNIEGDWSSASYWLVASALGADIHVGGLSMSSLQADKKILEAFLVAGCSVQHMSDGLLINGKKRHSFTFDATDCPDLFPALATFAALTPGISEIKGAKRLSSKESDRGQVLKTEFAKLGVRIDLVEDSMYIHGKQEIIGGSVTAHHDHRIAMCLAIAGIFATGAVQIDHAEAVSKSYPEFWDHLEKLQEKVS